MISTLRDANRAAVIRSLSEDNYSVKIQFKLCLISDYIALCGIEYKLVTSDNWFTVLNIN